MERILIRLQEYINYGDGLLKLTDLQIYWVVYIFIYEKELRGENKIENQIRR